MGIKGSNIFKIAFCTTWGVIIAKASANFLGGILEESCKKLQKKVEETDKPTSGRYPWGENSEENVIKMQTRKIGFEV